VITSWGFEDKISIEYRYSANLILFVTFMSFQKNAKSLKSEKKRKIYVRKIYVF